MIFTIGHSNHSIEYFIEILKVHGIEKIIEVRSVPKSKYSPHFNKVDLIYNLKKNGIDYIDMGKTLGGRPEDRSVLDVNNKIDLKKIETKEWYLDSIKRLIELSGSEKIALMCSEEDPRRCHRGYIISYTLMNEGIDVFHIRGDKRVEKAKFYPRQGVLDL